MSAIEKPQKRTAGVHMEKLEPCALLAGRESEAASIETRRAVPQKIKTIIIIRSNNPTTVSTQKTESRVSKRYLRTHVHGSTVHNSKELEATMGPLTNG